jgi:REP element-mobilizing transposase RayT
MIMTRPLRIQFPGALYHVTSRGNDRADIFLDDADRHAFLAVLDAVCQRMHWLCYAYCLMTNHYHLVIETPDGNLAAGMRQLNGVYTQRFNRRHDRVGHVFQGRYKAILVDRDAYLLELSRYVVLNPVRAGMVDAAGEWPWSSYRATAGQAPAPSSLAQGWLLSQFGRTTREAHQRYEQFVQDGLDQKSIWQGLRRQIYLGDDRFVDQMQTRLQDAEVLQEVPKVQRRPSPEPLRAYAQAHPDPHNAMVAAYRSGGYTMKAVADYFGVHYSTVSRAVRRAEETVEHS